MSRPNLMSYLVGNPLSQFAAFLFLLVVAVGVVHGSLSPIAVVVAIMIAAATRNAGERISEYRKWRREWVALRDEINVKEDQ